MIYDEATQLLCIYSVFVGPQKTQLYGKSKDISMTWGTVVLKN